jgi:hypothetical protein
MREVKLSPDISLIRKGESVFWIKVLGVRVHIEILTSSLHKEIMSKLLNQLKK